MKEYVPHNILVTGGAGFIGCNFVRYILSQLNKIKIVNLDKLTYAGDINNLANLPNSQNHVI